MKILYHHRIAAPDGGEAVHIEELIAALRQLGHEVIEVGHVDLSRPAPRNGRSFTSTILRVLPKAVREPLELSYSLVAYHRLRRACLTHRPDVLYERANLFSLAGSWIKRCHELPFILEVNAPLYQERRTHDGLAWPRLGRWSEETVWLSADRVLPVSQVLADFLRRAGVPEGRISVVPNAVNPKRFATPVDTVEAKRKLGLEGRTVLGFVGYVRAWHQLERGIDLLCAAERADLHFLLVGDGQGLEAVQEHARRQGVSDRVTVTGPVARDDMKALISSFDIALLPGVTAYASPLKIYEYMALGRAIVAPDAPNIREILSHGENALLFDPTASNGFGEAVERLLDDSGLRARLGRSARNTIIDYGLTWENNARRVIELVEELNKN